MPQSKFVFVVCTKGSSVEGRSIEKSLQRLNAKTRIFTNNQEGLSSCYNQILQDPSFAGHTAIFVHDDVVIEDLFLFDKLDASPYSVTGLAGARTFNVSAPKCAWHLATSREEMVGEVAHTSQGKTWTTVFGPTPSRALTLDGLFLAVRVDDVNKAGVLFNPIFRWHFYDIDFALKSNAAKLTVGVVPIRAIHHGLGDSMLTPEWDISNAVFKQLYHDSTT